MADPAIKPDPETAGASPAPFMEEDIYEDTEDLEFNGDPNYQQLYLARVPKYVWEAWSELDDDAEIRIGTVRRETETDAQGKQKQKLSVLLASDIAQHQRIPKEYALDLTQEDVKNTYVFTEQDLPGFKSKAKQKFDPVSANMPARLTRPKFDKPRGPWDPNKKPKQYFRKAVPKRTVLLGRIKRDLNCVPVRNEESERIITAMTIEAMQPKLHTKYISDDVSGIGNGFIQPGTVGASNAFGGFIKTTGPAAGVKTQLHKTARMPQNELLDKIFECFRKYNYWSMKSLRNELRQPEAYLRETLEKVAVLAKSGPFATTWSLKEENKLANYEGAGDSMAPTEGLDGADDSDLEMEDDEDEDVKFEDVGPA
ncbi:transcription initiation factor IIF [Phlyctema vagabunda]|uniref:Transcription initiation factor IIF n=1 Tax=Phlyctema vagabunda TaxID=108571 RepID=A0ABR4P5Q7_9HELO